jgi:RimJ/RimL family protein N-acetyltransferase
VSKIRYEIDLTRETVGIPKHEDRVRPVIAGDAFQLASLMLDAYRDTIDYDDENLDDAVAEIDSYLHKRRPLLDMSRVVVEDDEIVAGVLLSASDEGPFIDYVMTSASHKGRGLGALVTRHALAALAADGHAKVVFYITEGNEPSERLFSSLGAEATG